MAGRSADFTIVDDPPRETARPADAPWTEYVIDVRGPVSITWNGTDLLDLILIGPSDADGNRP